MGLDHKYVTQPDILEYLEHVVDRYDLRRTSSSTPGSPPPVFDESTDRWVIGTDTGETSPRVPRQRRSACCRPPTSPTSRASTPSQAGWCTPTPGPRTSTSPASGSASSAPAPPASSSSSPPPRSATSPSSSARRSTACRPATALSTPERSPSVKEDFDAIWDQVRSSVVAFGFEESAVEAMSVSEEERQRVFQERLGQGRRLPVHVRHVLRHRHRPGGQRGGRGVHPVARSPRSSRTRRPPASSPRRTCTPSARCATRATTRRSTATTSRWYRVEGDPDRRDHARRGAHGGRRASTSSTCWSSPPASTRSTATTGRWTCAVAGASTSEEHWADGPTSYLGVPPPASPTCS